VTDDERDVMLHRIDTRTELIEARQQIVIKEHEELRKDVADMQRRLFVGNGTPALASRIEALELGCRAQHRPQDPPADYRRIAALAAGLVGAIAAAGAAAFEALR
jgi:hypothetical protein